MDLNTREKLTEKQIQFLLILSDKLRSCKWSEKEIGEKIRESTKETEISPREGYVALYMLILGVDFGPRIASIILE